MAECNSLGATLIVMNSLVRRPIYFVLGKPRFLRFMPWTSPRLGKPLVDPDRAVWIVHRAEHQDLALEAARETILLKNDHDLLPLRKTVRSIAVIGPNADDAHSQLGDYVPRNIPQHVVTPCWKASGRSSLPGPR